MQKFLVSTAVFAGLCLASASQAATVATPDPRPAAPASVRAASVDLSVTGPLTIGYQSPTFGTVLLGVSPDNPLAAPLLGGSASPAPDFAASYTTYLKRGLFGVSAGYINGGSLFTAAPTAGWNLGVSAGYAGFYLHGGISDATQQQLQQHLTNDPSKGWLAGFGYQTGGFNVRLSYMTAQSPLAADTDSRTWMIGGIYQLSARVRVNADAFTSHDTRFLNALPLAAANNAAAPQGTGARVGVQLRF